MRLVAPRWRRCSAAARSRSPVSAAAPTFWQTATEADFLKGEVESLAIDPFGRLTLGPMATHGLRLERAVPLGDGDGARRRHVTSAAATRGRCYRIDANGRGRVFFDSDELEVHALAPVPGGGLYVGTSPNGKIYKVDATGKGDGVLRPARSVHLEPRRRSRRQRVRGTGDKGTIYKITPDGRGAVFYETKATHAMTLAFDREGRLLAGTGTPGRVFRLDAAGKPFVLFDSSYAEIHALRVDGNGAIYAIAVSGRSGGGGSAGAGALASPEPAAAPVATVSTEITSVAVADVSVSAAPASAAGGRGRRARSSGAIFRIGADGGTDLRVGSARRHALRPRLRARRQRRRGDRRQGQDLPARRRPGPGHAHRARERAAGDGARAAIATARCCSPRRTRASCSGCRATAPSAAPITSDVRDAQTVATWGAIKWQALMPAGTRVEVSTRRGNTRTPDETWSDWSAPYAAADGSAITSPRARYLQWRAVLDAERRSDSAAADVGHGRVPAAQRAAARHVDHRAHAGHRVPAAVPHRRARDCRLRRRHARPARGGAAAGRRRRRSPTWDAAPTRRGC